MPATVTLATTTLTYWIDSGDLEFSLASVAGILPGYRLWIDKESIQVKRITGSRVQVVRGQDGSASAPHSSGSTVTIARPDQLYQVDPIGAPGSSIPVSPYINTINGKVWLAQGDPLPENGALRWWQEVTTTYGTASLGVLSQTSSPTVSM